MAATTVSVPDIGDFDNVPVIEVLVAPGDSVGLEDPLITLESDKATMDVPSPLAGVVSELKVQVGDAVSQGSQILVLELSDAAESAEPQTPPVPQQAQEPEPQAAPAAANAPPAAPPGDTLAVEVPDIGDFEAVPIIEVLVKPGDHVQAEDALITLESDKASMDVPAPAAGVVKELKVAVGDTVSQGALILTLATEPAQAPTPVDETRASGPPSTATPEPAAAAGLESKTTSTPPGRALPTAALEAPAPSKSRSHATPAVRRFARDLGVDLTAVTGTGRKGRIVRDDLLLYVKGELGKARPGQAGMGIEPIPAVDFSKFGAVETQPLSRIKALSGPHLHRAWLNVPHVTHHDEADVTELEAFRKSLRDDAEREGVKLTPLTFILKALVVTLRQFPTFNASLSPEGDSLIIKSYFHLGVAVDTPNGLVVPVIRDVDTKGVLELSKELGEVSGRAREGKLKPADLQGGCMSVSSLGGIGGRAFTPIINAPEVAILGVSRAAMTPVWDGDAFAPRLMLPLDLSYDHRVIDGAEAARFTVHLATVLGDIRRLLL